MQCGCYSDDDYDDLPTTLNHDMKSNVLMGLVTGCAVIFKV